jgi:hypothetical protein
MRSGAAVICLALVVTCLGAAPGGAESIADYQGTSVYSGFADSEHTTAQGFELIGGATATEIQLLLSRNEPGDTGSAVMELRRADPSNYGRPSPTSVATVSLPITDVPHGWLEGAKWISFNLSPSVSLDPPASGPNRWWIVLKNSGYGGGSGQAQIHWPAGTSGYGTGDDCMPSYDNGTTWTNSYPMDCNFKVFGTRSPLSTNMTITVDPEPIAKNGKTNVSVVVKDSYDNLVPGMGTVHWNAPDGGTFRCSWCSLVDGEACNEWTAPADSTGTYTVEVTFDAWSYSGYDYSSTSGSAEIHVLEPNRPTTGALALAPPIVNTRGQIDVTFGPVRYWDSLQQKNVNVPGGSVSFSCDTEGAGTFTADSAAVGADAVARTKWTAKNLVDTFNLTGTYGGYQQGSYI